MSVSTPLRHVISHQNESASEQSMQGDLAMLEKLREILDRHFGSEKGYGRFSANAIIARFAELIENNVQIKRSLVAIADGQKLAMAQMQFAQTVVHQLERAVEVFKRENGKSLPSPDNSDPDMDLKGE